MKRLITFIALTLATIGCTFTVAEAKEKYYDKNYIFKSHTFHKWVEHTGMFKNKFETNGNMPKTGHNLLYVTDHTRDGGSAMRFELGNGECSGFDKNRGDYKCAMGRTEVTWGSGAYGTTGEVWYRWSLYIDSNNSTSFPKGNGWQQFMQMKFNTDAQHNNCPVIPLQFKVKNNELQLTRELARDIDYIADEDDCNPSDKKTIFNSKDQFTGKWLDFVVHVDWTHKDDGFMKIWINGDKVYDIKGPTTNRPYFKNGKKYGPVFRNGIYEGRRIQDSNATTVVWYDAMYGARHCEKMNFEAIGYNCGQFN